jgi:type IV pilus assembly protein PilB
MVGEIRDLETAEIALQAALTGHLVFSTLHTNDAPGAMTRLLDMGAEPFLLAATVEAILAQRLVRCICPSCRQEHEPPAELLAQLDLATPSQRAQRFFRGRGCAQCAHTGYRGRMGIFEWLMPTDPLRELVTERAPVQQLRQKARVLGMRTLRDDALRAATEGFTTLEEVVKYT